MNSEGTRIDLSQRGTVQKITRVFYACLLVLLFCLPTFSQLNNGRIYGAITDQTGGAIAGATVTIIDVARGISRPLMTDSDGQYAAPSLLPGTYTVRAEVKGFSTIDRENVVLEVGQDIKVDLTLQPGEQTQTVTVTEAIPMVNTSNATLSATLENHDVNELPLNGRQYTKLMAYTPGVQAIAGTMFNVNGNRFDAQTWLFDGVDELNVWSAAGPIAGGASSSFEAAILPLDAIQEVNIQENPQAEFGWKPGAQVNVGLKSGTNSMHGTLYAYGRDTALDAKNPFLPGTLGKAQDELTQWGASIGGPIKKDKLFYFANFEGQDYAVGSPHVSQIPTSGFLTGTCVGGGNCTSSLPAAIYDIFHNTNNTHSVAPNQLSLNLAGCDQSLATMAAATSPSQIICSPAVGIFQNGTGSQAVPTAYNNVGGSDSGIGKVDYHLNDHNSINGEYFQGDFGVNSAVAAAEPWWVLNISARAKLARAVWLWTPNSSWVNEARFGFDGYRSYNAPAECNAQVGQPNYATEFGFVSGAQAFNPPECGFPVTSISGFAGLGASGNAIYYSSQSYAGIDNVSYTRGKHQIKFGGEAHFTQFAGYGLLSNGYGNVKFGSGGVNTFTGATPLEDFLTGVPSSEALQVGFPSRNITVNRYAVFLQDDWRVTSRLTVNLGLRYEYYPPISDANDLLGNFSPNSATGLVQAGKQIGSPYGADTKDFSPRVGFAWDVTGHGTTVVRAGGSIIYTFVPLQNLLAQGNGAQLNGIPTGFTLHNADGSIRTSPGTIQLGTVSLTNQVTTANPTGALPWAVNTPVFNSTPSALACSVAVPCTIAGIDPNFHLGYVSAWNLSVQHAFTRNLSLNLAYVGAHATHLGGTIDENAPALGVNTASIEQQERPFTENCSPTSVGGPNSAPGGLGLDPAECFPYLGKVQIYSDNLDSNYNALQASLTQRLSDGLSFTLGYTLAHSLDESTTPVTNFVENQANPRLDYGPSTNDARNDLNLLVSYNIPGRKSPGQILEGWQVNSVLNAHSAVPFNALDGTDDLSGTGENEDRWTISGPPSNFRAGGPSPFPCFSTASGSFASSCTIVAAGTGAIGSSSFVANMPAACVAAASAEPRNPNVPTTFKNYNGLAALADFGCYYENGAAIVPPAQGTFGNMGRDILRGRGYEEWDLSATKVWKFEERFTVQFRAEFFNVLNRTQYAAPAGSPATPSTFGASASTPNTSDPITGLGGPRTIQLGLKLIF